MAMRSLILATAFLATAAAAQVPGLSAADRDYGARAHPQLMAQFGGAYTGPQADYVRGVGQRIAMQSGLARRPTDYTVTLLNANLDNAFAIPGGYVYVTRQLVALMNDEAELAFVLGHEIAHVAARHSAKRETRAAVSSVLAGLAGAITGSDIVGTIANAGATLYTRGFSREQERAADSLGIRYLARAGYDPAAGADILGSLGAQTSLSARLAGRSGSEGPSWLSTHPATADRVARARREAAAIPAARRAIGRDAFLNAIDGMAYDDDAAQGVVEGRRFRHPQLGLGFEAPAGFTMQNGAAAVTGAGQNGAQFQFAGGMADPGATSDMAAYSARVWQGIGGSGGPVQPTRINGIDAGISRLRSETRNGPVDAVLAVYAFGPGRFYHVLGIAPAGQAAVFDPLIGSVRRLAPGEAGQASSRRVAVVTVRAGDSIASLATRMAYSDDRLARFTVLNGLAAGARLRVGDRIKLIVWR